MKSLIEIHKNNLESNLCEDIIKRFAQWYDDGKVNPGVTFSGYDPNIKDSYDLHISQFEEWEDIDSILYEALTDKVTSYLENVITKQCELSVDNIEDSGYQIQRTTSEQNGYPVHNDGEIIPHNNNFRVMTYLWYLNDVEGGGWTEFPDRCIIKPETGKLILFPANWTYPHIGHPPKTGNKYIITGWVYSSIVGYDSI